MRILRWMIVALGMVGGAIGLGAASQAAPLPVAAVAAGPQAGLVEQAHWRHHRRHWHRHHWHRHRHWHHRRHWHRHHWHRRHHWHHRHHWRRHHGWHHRHYGWHRPHRVRIFY